MVPGATGLRINVADPELKPDKTDGIAEWSDWVFDTTRLRTVCRSSRFATCWIEALFLLYVPDGIRHPFQGLRRQKRYWSAMLLKQFGAAPEPALFLIGDQIAIRPAPPFYGNLTG